MNACRSLSAEEYRLLRHHVSRYRTVRDVALLSFMRWTGYRIREVLSTRVCDVAGPNGTVYSKISIDRSRLKGRRRRPAVMVHPQLADDLEKHLSDMAKKGILNQNGYLFLSRKGKNRPISYVQAYRIVKEACEAEEVYGSVACHSLRKTFATGYYVATGKDIRATQEVLGHSSPVITQLYIGIDPESMKTGIMEQSF